MNWDEQIGSRTLYGECRGEPEEGQRAVAHVLWNRVRDGRWGNTIAQVCLAKLQFSCWNATDPQREKMAALPDDDATLQKLSAILRAEKDAADDPSRGATHYYADTLIVPPKWAVGATFCRQIGHHLFYKDVK